MQISVLHCTILPWMIKFAILVLSPHYSQRGKLCDPSMIHLLAGDSRVSICFCSFPHNFSYSCLTPSSWFIIRPCKTRQGGRTPFLPSLARHIRDKNPSILLGGGGDFQGERMQLTTSFEDGGKKSMNFNFFHVVGAVFLEILVGETTLTIWRYRLRQ